ncbi:MAG: DNA polymerase I [Oscillospiraceae bacterium]|jgi:DNA polymerase I-like protein with 3'-5' exonuclease and polymerase domains/5'-3' exonuclease|nr:DNA polymerase I [Oscillospiraceae bacterium]
MKLVALDGNSILNRAYFGIKPLTTSGGQQTQAVLGFINILRSIQNNEKPDALCVAFDLHAPTFRHELSDSYKATRKGMPEDLRSQVPYIKRVLDALNIKRFEIAGYEADDILGTVSRVCSESGWDCTLVTGDRDALQLIGQGTRIRLIAGKGEQNVYGTKEFEAKYGFSPKSLVDLKALMGDSSDNIPGVAGIGEKTASELIVKYSSLDAVYDNLGDIKDSIRKKLEAGRKSAELSYKLALINPEVPIEFEPSGCKNAEPDSQKLLDVLTELELSSLITKYGLAPKAKPPEADSGQLSFGFEEIAPETDEQRLMYWILNPGEPRRVDNPEELLRERDLWELYSKLELPLMSVLRDMSLRGFAVDKGEIEHLGSVLAGELNALELAIYELSGETFNINSPKQLGEVLFDKLRLDPKAKKTKTGAYSTNIDILENLRQRHPCVGGVIEYRKLAKLKSTYCDGLIPLIDSGGRIHTTFNMTATATGRISSSNPNLQNIPIRGERGAELRKFFIAPEGFTLIDADYSQIELRVLADMAQDEAMIEAFRNNADIHSITAAYIFGVSDVTKEQRMAAKRVNFGVVYGMSDFALSNDLGVSVAEAKRYIESFFERYSGVRGYFERLIGEARELGYVTTKLGRRRYIPELNASNFQLRKHSERAARNAPIQGTAADIIKIAMLRIAKRLETDGFKARLILQVHDELIIESPSDEAAAVAALVKEEMRGAYELSVPLVVDIGTGHDWYGAK